MSTRFVIPCDSTKDWMRSLRHEFEMIMYASDAVNLNVEIQRKTFLWKIAQFSPLKTIPKILGLKTDFVTGATISFVPKFVNCGAGSFAQSLV